MIRDGATWLKCENGALQAASIIEPRYLLFAMDYRIGNVQVWVNPNGVPDEDAQLEEWVTDEAEFNPYEDGATFNPDLLNASKALATRLGSRQRAAAGASVTARVTRRLPRPARDPVLGPLAPTATLDPLLSKAICTGLTISSRMSRRRTKRPFPPL